jgi:streptogramin lyase
MHPRLPLLLLASALLAAHSPLTAASLRTIAGTGVKGFSGDGGPANAAQINNPFGVVRGPDGNLWFCEYGGQRIRTISASGTIRTVAGNGQTGYSGDGGPATAASLNQPHEIRFDRAGDLYIVDMQNHAVRKVVLSTGLITTIVGTGKPGYSGDGGPATAAQLNQPHSIQFDSAGDLYICDIRNNVIRKVTTQTGIITTFAGTGKPGDTPDHSPIVGTPLRGPRTLDFDSAGNLWLATREGNQVFRFDLTAGRIHHLAGTGKKGFTGDHGPALAATLAGPKGLTVGRDGRVYLVDTENHAIRVIDPKTHLISTVVGMGKLADGPDGDSPLTAGLARPHGIWVDPDGTVFIGDSENHRLRALK